MVEFVFTTSGKREREVTMAAKVDSLSWLVTWLENWTRNLVWNYILTRNEICFFGKRDIEGI